MKFHPDDLALDYELLIHFSPSSAQREALAKSGYAMPDGSFYIRKGSVSDLNNAISAVGRATPNAGESETARRNAVRRHIMKRARSADINRPDMIPDTWNSDGSLKQSALLDIQPGTVLDRQTADWLEHFGVKGMRWGVRREGTTGAERRASLTGFGGKTMEITRITKSGDKITLSKSPPTLLHKAMATLSNNYAREYNQAAWFTIKDKDGKRVGSALVDKRPKGELYLNWINIKPSARGRGYATATLKAAEEYGSQHGYQKMTLEVPKKALDARHIYQKMGFKFIGEDTHPDDAVFGGLTKMEYKFKPSGKAVHADPPDDFSWLLEAIDQYIVEAIAEQESMQMTSEVQDFLEHFGVKGMRWGVRREGRSSGSGFNPAGGNHPSLTAPRPRTSEDAAVARGLESVVKRQGTGALSNRELQTLVNRQLLERQYSSLNQQQVSAGRKMVNDLTREMAKQTAQQAIKTYGPKGAKWLAKRAAMAGTKVAVGATLAAL